jgi:5-formyltetrahydrofolate cyclo-ligase
LSKKIQDSAGKKIQDRVRALCKDFFKHEKLKSPKIMLYVSVPGEVSTRKLMDVFLTKGCVWIPRCNNDDELDAVSIRSLDDLCQGRFIVPEPSPFLLPYQEPGSLNVVLVPGVAFDKNGHRLGRGKGHYDRFLSRLGKNPLRVGLAYDAQVLDELSVSEHDQPVDVVITETSLYISSHKPLFRFSSLL